MLKQPSFVAFLIWLATLHPVNANTNPLFTTVDLSIGETVSVELANGDSCDVELVAVDESLGDVWGQVDRAEATIRIDAKQVTLVSGMYRLPEAVGDFQVDCPITGGLRATSHIDHWALEKDARLRIWPKDSPWIRPGTFGYPVKQQWFASQTWFSNEPVAARPNGQLYYHSGLDIGGAESLTEVVAATDAVIVSKGNDVHPDHTGDTPINPRYDVLYLMDERGWYYRYSHLHSFDPRLRLGQVVSQGDRLGLLGKEGGSGGWSHLHFEIFSRQPSGRWGTQDGYAFLWQAYLAEYQPQILSVARPGHVVFAGQTVELDGSRSWSAGGDLSRFHWIFSSGGSSDQATAMRTYPKPGSYCETLKVADSSGRLDYDFTRVRVYDRANPTKSPPRLHLAFHPTTDIRPATEIILKGRAFDVTGGEERWDFGDGSPVVTTCSDGNVEQLAKDGYVIVKHRYEEPGDYLVHVRRTDDDGRIAEDRLHIRVVDEPESRSVR